MSARIASVREAIEKALYDKKQPWTKYFQMLEEKSGCKRIQLFMGMVAFIAVYLVFGYGPQLLCNLIGFGYPAYCSMKAVETQQKDDDTKWLTYWVVFASFSLAEYFSNVICSWIPVYWLLKTLILVWCMAPIENNGSILIQKAITGGMLKKTKSCIFLVWCFLPIPLNGSIIIYNKYIRPYFLQHQTTVDGLLNDLTHKGIAKASEIAANVKSQ